MKRKDIIRLNSTPHIISSYSVVGKKEFQGPLGRLFDEHSNDMRFGRKTWELAESEMQKRALVGAITKSGIPANKMGWIFAGDLQNQCAASSYGLMDFDLPFIGLYGACSTFGEALISASIAIESKAISTAAVVTSSHFCTAERQFRFPLPYGNQRQPIAQRTVTGAGAFILSNEGNGARITEVMVGRIVDKGISDANNMGAAMAPAAADTLYRYFNESGTCPSDFDVIVTGDLASEGEWLLRELLRKEGIDLGASYTDCGLMIYNMKEQDVHAGASGCGCSCVVFSGFFMKKLMSGEIKNMLLVTTGALMNTGSLNQGNTIPGIAHLVRIEGGQT